MATILPEESELPDIYESEHANVEFGYILNSGEEFLSMSVESEFPDYIEHFSNGYKGEFNNLFELPPGSLKYTKGLEYGEAQKFSELPPKGTADLYSYTAPKIMLKNFNVSVNLKILDSIGTEINITKQYIQPVRGNWSTFKAQFLNYVR